MRPGDPLLNCRFVLELGSIQVAGFREVTGLQAETKIFEYKEGGRNYSPHKLPDGAAAGNVTLKRGITMASEVLFRWHHDVAMGNFNAEVNRNLRSNGINANLDPGVKIILQDDAGEDQKRWILFRAFPVKWVGPEFKAQASEIAIESLELACEGIQLV